MKYFCTSDERKGTCYIEFQKGEFNENFWLDDSLLIDDDSWYDSGLEDFFFAELPELEDFGTVSVTNEQWKVICDRAEEYEESVSEAVGELKDWAEETFREHDVFTILGL